MARRVILITCDTLRADHLGCYGYPRGTSPRIDALAAQCRVFENAWSAAPLTSPSISALLAGRPPEEIGTASRSNSLRMPASVQTLAESVSAAGIDTAAFVSSSVLVRPPPELGSIGVAQGFEHFDDELVAHEHNREMRERDAASCTSAVLRWLDARPDEADRFFLWVHYQDPHGPYTPPAADLAPLVREHAGEAQLELGTNSSGAGQIPDYQQIDGERRPGPYVDRYDAEIHAFDAEFGRLVDALRARGWLDDSLLVLTADHGESLGEHGFWFCHGETLQRELLHVPLLVHAPRAFALAPSRSNALATYLDFWPTALEALGIPAGECRGRSLLAADIPQGRIAVQALGRAQYGRTWFAITDGRWRLLSIDPLPPQLFDLERDPGEESDLAAQRPDLVQALRDAHARWLEQSTAPALTGVPRRGEEHALHQLGYTPALEEDH